MKLFICPNYQSDDQKEDAKYCIQQLTSSLGAECSMTKEASLGLFNNEDYVRFGCEEADMVVAIGGDGTVLRSAQIAVNNNKPLLGIKSGRLGYLCALKVSDMENISEKMIQSLDVQERSLIEFVYEGKEYHCLNDVVIGKNDFGETIELEVFEDNIDVGSWRADGIIVSTPTGSTSYNLSAGGPIVLPDINAVVITPICPHSLDARPMVVSGKKEIKIKIIRSTSPANLYADGIELGKSKDISLHISDEKLQLLSYDNPLTGLKELVAHDK